MMVTVLRLAAKGELLSETPNLIDYVKRGEARPAFGRALEDQLAAFREHEPEGMAA
jgi:glutathione S-transferase